MKNLIFFLSLLSPVLSYAGSVDKKALNCVLTTVKIETNKSDKTSVVNIVANKINFISHDGEHTFNLTDPKQLITDDEQQKINNEAHPIV
jgi:hypothetical protein